MRINDFSKGKSKNILILFIFMIFLVVPGVIAQATPQLGAAGFAEGYSIEFTKISFYENHKDILFNAHVFNISFGLRLTNESASCAFHLFDNAGKPLLDQQPMTFEPIGLDWEFLADKGNFTRNGQYSYLIVCNSSTLGGFSSIGFEISPGGFELDSFPFEFSLSILGFILVIIGMMSERLRIFQIIGAMMMIIMGIITLFPGYAGLNWETLMGKVLGFSLIGIGFYSLISHAFSREEQGEYYSQ